MKTFMEVLVFTLVHHCLCFVVHLACNSCWPCLLYPTPLGQGPVNRNISIGFSECWIKLFIASWKWISLLLPVVPNATCLTSSLLSLKFCSLSHSWVSVLCLGFHCKHCVHILTHTSILSAYLAVINHCKTYCVFLFPLITNMISSLTQLSN